MSKLAGESESNLRKGECFQCVFLSQQRPVAYVVNISVFCYRPVPVLLFEKQNNVEIR